MRASEFISEVKMDGRNGIGAVPMNADVDYFGLRILIEPLTWLRMALELTMDADTDRQVTDMAKYIKDGGAVGQPWFNIKVPPEWDDGDFSQPAQITGHEGRHRMEAIIKAEGNSPVEAHLFFSGGVRARDITPDWITRLNSSIINERGRLVQGPWFEVM
jgi:hypothetical protein